MRPPIFYLLLERGLDDLPLRVFFPPAHPLARRDVPVALAKVFRFSHLCPKGNSQTVLHCAHGTSTVSSCAFCEQEGWSGCSPPLSILQGTVLSFLPRQW